jgi:beta-galactosidase/beta-glucuronidase
MIPLLRGDPMPSIDPTQHPRPLLRRPTTSLDGTWDFAGDPDLEMSHPSQVDFDRTISVPFAPETPASGIGWKGPLRRAWYRRPLPAATGRRTVVHFGAVDRSCDVWVGDAHVGAHEGGYTPFSVDVTDHLGAGAQLAVRADDDPLDLEAPRGKQDWLDDPHFIWYPRTTGIWRSVWVEQVERVSIEDVEWRGDAKKLTVTMRVRLSVPVSDHRVHLRLFSGGRLLVDDVFRIDGQLLERTVRIGDGTYEDRVKLLWWPRRPGLLDAELAVTNPAGDVLDEVESYTALRSVTCEDGQFLVNGRPFPLRLVLDQGYWQATGATPPDSEALRKDLELTRSLGFNGARKHQKVEDPRYYAWADRMGLLLWAEMPSAYRYGDTAALRLLREWPEVVRAHRGYPSIVAWVPTNESWGVFEVEHDRRQQAFVRAMADVARALDGTRPLSVNDGWETSGGDILGIHDYEQDAAQLARRYLDADAVDRVSSGRSLFGQVTDLDRVGRAGRTAVLSEFGGISLKTHDLLENNIVEVVTATADWGYASAASPADLLERYRSLWAAVNGSSGLAGGCYTQLTDTYQEVNGLLRMDRTPKVDPQELARATRSEPTPC